MLKLFTKRTKMNHKGMTLVEVIVAMAILSIVVVPTLRMFASSASTNHSSRLRQRATIVGESVMESFKAYDMEALCKQFRAGTFKGVTTCGTTTMSVVAEYGSSEGSPFRPDDELDQDATAYVFKANDVISEGQHYDIVVDAEPIEQPEVLRMDSPNAYSDAIITLDKNFNTRIITEMTAKAKSLFLTAKPERSASDITDIEMYDLKRVITITVEDDGNAQKVILNVDCSAKANVHYRYIPGAGMSVVTGTHYLNSTELTESITLPDEDSIETDWVVYDNTATIAGTEINGRDCKLNQIYLYYCPGYETVFGDGASDEIIVNATLTTLYDPDITTEPEAEGYLPLRVNIAKQVNTDITSIELNNQEVIYSASVTANVSGGGQAILISNLEQNLSGEESLPADVPISGFSNGDEGYSFEEGVVDEVELLYNVVIHVYKQGTTEEIATFAGTTNE